jgi:hypothetical protein
LGLFFEYKKFLLTPSARIDTSIRAIFTTVSHDVVARARANPSLNGAELERLTFMVFQNFVNTQVGSISLANGLYSMRLNNNRGKTDNWVSTPIRDADMGAIIQSVPPSFLANPGAGWQVFFPGQNLGAI